VNTHEQAIGAGLDAVLICNPTQLHVETAEPYVEASVPVLIEKPLCPPEDEPAAQRLAAMAFRGGVPLGMAYCLRYHPAYRLAREAIASGRIGRVLYVKAWFESYLPDWHPWEDHRESYAARADLGGGAIPTLDHEIDFFNWCLGEPESVLGITNNSRSLGVDANDHAMLVLRYPRGVTAAAALSFCRRDRSRGFEFIGENGTLRFRWEDARLEILGQGESPTVLWHEPEFDINRMYVHLLVDFLLAVVAGEAPPIPLSAGLSAVHVCRSASGLCQSRAVGGSYLPNGVRPSRYRQFLT
jgi:predicted dehydrogenase